MISQRHSLPRDAYRSLLLYNFFFPFVFGALLPGYLLRMLRRGGFRENFWQRFGRFRRDFQERFAAARPIWIHSISVGETLVALKVARALHSDDPHLRVVVSVTTSTGFALAQTNSPAWLETIYNPIDLPGIVRRALNVIRPCQLVFVEGEIWPNLLAECHRRMIPVSLINARLSPQSESSFRRFRRWTSPIFRLLDLVCVPDISDAPRWHALAIDPQRIHHTGSIKFDESHISSDAPIDELRAILRQIGVRPETPVLLGGSTWAPEERTLAEIALAARSAHPDLLLILVPRHVERIAEILRDLEPLSLRLLRRTEIPPADGSSPPAPICDVLLVDTTGELRYWYQLATVVFVGKSLDAIGGQNPAEPAFSAKPVIVGPHMENFTALVQQLRANDAIVQVEDAAALHHAICALLANEVRRSTLGRRARETLQVHQGATERTARLLRDQRSKE